MDEESLDSIFFRLAKSSFRSRFSLSGYDLDYAQKRSLATLTKHAHEFVSSRLADENPKKDGKQTPFKGHPVFVAQHATGTCCRSCLEKWHAIPKGRKVTSTEQQRIVDLIIEWIRRQLPDQLPEKENKTETDVHECDTAIRETQRELFNRREEQ